MVRVWCPDCEKVVNMYPEDRDKGIWSAGKRSCPHKMSTEKKEKYQIHVRWFLKDGTELVSRARKPQWELRKPNE